MNKLDTDLLSDELDLERPPEYPVIPSEGTEVLLPEPEPSEGLTDVGADTELARENIKELIKEGVNALKELLPIAKTSQAPRAYEVAATLMKTLSELNKDLLEVHQKKADIEDQTGKTSTKINVDKAIVFSGSTTEFIKLIKKTTDDIIN